MFSEHSGIINIALEGIMVIGGVAGVLTLTVLPSSMSPALVVLISILVAALAGIVYSLLLAFASINLKADQTIGGTALKPAGDRHCSHHRQIFQRQRQRQAELFQ